MTEKQIMIFKRFLINNNWWDKFLSNCANINIEAKLKETDPKSLFGQLFDVSRTSEGPLYWVDIINRWYRHINIEISAEDDIFDGSNIELNILTGDMTINYQVFDKEKQMKLLKILADNLNYKIEAKNEKI